MKPILFISFLIILSSCNNKADFYFGTWELNEENGVSTITLSKDKKLDWDIRGMRIMDNMDFEAVKISSNKYNIVAGQGNDCIKITMQRLNDNQCIGYNYKCYIDENMIDEVFVARKNQHPIDPISKPKQEVVILPKGYKGDFFIVYQYLTDDQPRKIKINDKGIGINQGEPDFKQLFNANRIFRFEGEKRNIPIVNPNGYNELLNKEVDSLVKEEKVVIIQGGFNQSGRVEWNKEHDENVKNSSNIEYFEVRWIKNKIR